MAVCAGLDVAMARAGEAFEWRPWPTGHHVPPLNLPLTDGTPWMLEAQSGKVVLANFWATWCIPCRAEMPSLVRLAARRSADKLVVVGVNYRESAATITRFLDTLMLKLPTLLDSDGDMASVYTPRIFPSTVIFGRRGRPLGTVVGEIDWGGEAANRILAPLLAPGRPG